MEYEVVENYKLYDKITETGGACLYRAKNTRDTDNDEYFYAIKTYFNELIPKEMLEREKNISHEIENHAPKSIVIPILDVIKSGTYAVMQFRKNGLFLNELLSKLEEKYSKGNIPLGIILDIVHEILSALKVLHSFWKKDRLIGYLHMDLHPGNIFFESVDIENQDIGRVKFLDFFSSRKMENGKVIQATELIDSITRGYSSPEQVNREYDIYGPCSDLYSVGAIFYRMLTGHAKSDLESIMENEFFEHIKNREEHFVVKYAVFNFLGVCMNENTKYRYKSAEKMMQSVELLKQCYVAYVDKKYYTLLDIGYRMVVPEDKIEPVNDEFSKREFEAAVNQLESDLKQDSIGRNRCMYIYNCLYKYVNLYRKDIEYPVLYSLLKSGIACCNHVGNTYHAEKLYGEIENIKNYLPLMEYLGCLNRVAVLYADRHEYEKAYKVVCDNIKSLEMIKNTYKEVAKGNGISIADESGRIIDLARAYSAKGTYMVLTQRDNPKTEFENALKEFGNSIGNKLITISHILQYAIEIKNINLYEEYSKQYFKAYKTLDEGLDKITENEKPDNRLEPFSLLVFLKGVYTFYMDKVDENFIDKVKKLLNMPKITKLHEHPVQLIYRYIGLILYKYSGKMTKEADAAMIISMKSIPSGIISLNKPLNIMMCITYDMMWIYNELTSQDDENKELLNIMKEHCKLSGWDKVYDMLEETKQINGIFTYEYA